MIISLEISSQFVIFFLFFSFSLVWSFISLQIKEFQIMGLSINDSVYSSCFFFLTGLHFFHLFVGLFLVSLLFWCCSFLIILFLSSVSPFLQLPLVYVGLYCGEKFHSDGRILTLHYYFSLSFLCILFSSVFIF